MPIQTAADSLTNVSGGSPYAFKNRLINGDFRIWQRGTSSSSAGYLADRWYHNSAGTYARSTDVPTGQGFKYSLSNAVTTATSYGVTLQRIESNNCYDLGGATVTLSFWMKTLTGSTGMYCNLYYANSADDFTTAVTLIESKAFTSTTSWAKYTLTFNNISANAVNGLQVYFFSADAAVAPSYLITGVQLEKGNQATGFDWRPYGTEESLCQRYYYRLSPVGSGLELIPGLNPGTTSNLTKVPLPVTMRVKPSIETSSAGWGFVRNRGSFTAYTTTGTSARDGSTPGFAYFDSVVASGLTSAEIGYAAINDGSWLAFSAEL